MRTVRHERAEMRHVFQKNISKTFNHSVRFLPFVESVAEACINRYNVVYIPKYLSQEVGSSFVWNNILVFEPIYPALLSVK